MFSHTHAIIPRPHRMEILDGSFVLPQETYLAPVGDLLPAWAQVELRTRWEQGGLSLLQGGESKRFHLKLHIDSELGVPDEGYHLNISTDHIQVVGRNRAGLYYGCLTLMQWLRLVQSRENRPDWLGKGLVIEDWPDFPNRGVMLDISRCKVPTMATLFELVDRFTSLRINQLQLYMEHSFAYAGHQRVWRDASPLTASQVRELDAYCRDRFIALVPNQNSFGHFHRWLVHEPYRAMAEVPKGVVHPFSTEPEPFSLCATDSRVFPFLAGLYDQLLPHFSASSFNVGLDETFDLGLGRSREVCERRGKEILYLEYLNRIHGLVRERGFTMQFWGDIVFNHPELIERLPRDAVGLIWGYEADHPFDEQCRKLAASGLDYYVCPGTSSWSSFGGRLLNATLNLARAAEHGFLQKASGYLMTDWGDHGHAQPLSISYVPWFMGSAFCWNVGHCAEPRALMSPQILSDFVFGDLGLAETAHELGLMSRLSGAAVNGSALFFLFHFIGEPLTFPRVAAVTSAGLAAVLERLETLAGTPRTSLDGEAAWIQQELEWVGLMLKWCARLGLARIAAGREKPADQLPRRERERLVADLDLLSGAFQELWRLRHREGGLAESLGRFKRVRGFLAG